MSFKPYDFQALRELALSKRIFGRLTIEHQLLSESSPVESECVNEFLKRFGFTGSHADLHQINRKEAAQQAVLVLNRDLAYGVEVMTKPEAQQIASSFLNCFERPTVRYFTNGERIGNNWAGNPISDSTFDQGIIALNDEAIGILWAQDED